MALQQNVLSNKKGIFIETISSVILLKILINIGTKYPLYMYISYRYKIDQLASEKHMLHFIQIRLHLYNFVTDHSIQSPFGISLKPNMYLEYWNVFQGNFIPYESYQYWNIVNIFLTAFMFKLYIINCFHFGSMSKYIITESDFCPFVRDKCLFDTFAQHICWLSIQNRWMCTWISPPVLRNKCYMALNYEKLSIFWHIIK